MQREMQQEYSWQILGDTVACLELQMNFGESRFQRHRDGQHNGIYRKGAYLANTSNSLTHLLAECGHLFLGHFPWWPVLSRDPVGYCISRLVGNRTVR
jgi:hypothetical protein